MEPASNFPVSKGLTVERIAVPQSPQESQHSDFRAFHDLDVANQLALWGDTERCATFPEAVVFWQGNEYEERQVFLARLGRTVVGGGSLTLPLSENTTTAGLDVQVDAAYRRRGIGTAILETLERTARDRNRVSFDGFCGEPIGPVLAGAPLLDAKSGTGGVPRYAASTQFAVHHGYSLEQVETSSSLHMPVPADVVDGLEAAAVAKSAGYSVVGWEQSCPAEFVDGFARLKSLMSTEVPIAGLGWEGEVWDAARVRQEEATWEAGGIKQIVAAARHEASGRLAGYTVLTHRDGLPGVINQEDTLVDPAHRGHSLGMLLKVANLRRAGLLWPEAMSVMTWNASENQHMLAINIALGFKPSGFEGEWQKRLG